MSSITSLVKALPLLIVVCQLLVLPRVSGAAPRQFLYKAPKSEITAPPGSKVKRLQVGPIIGTPQSGKIERWSQEEKGATDGQNESSEEGQDGSKEVPEVSNDNSSTKEASDLEKANEAIGNMRTQIQSMPLEEKPTRRTSGLNEYGVYVDGGNNYSRLNRIKENIIEKREADQRANKQKNVQEKENLNGTLQAIQRRATNTKGNTISQAFSGDPFDGTSKKELQRKIAKYNKALELESKREKEEQKEVEIDQASNALFAKQADFNDIERDGDEITVYRMTSKQKKAAELQLPPVPKRTRPVWTFQVTPPNVSQKTYNLDNAHLSPVMFQYEIDKMAFKAAGDPYGIQNLVALISKITDINMQDKLGNTLLLNSVSNANYDTASFLIRSGANVNLPNDFGVTPTHLAVYKQDYKMLGILLDNSPDMGSFDSNGITSLMYAVILGDRYMIQTLVERGANALLENKSGMSALSIAVEYDDADVINYLKEHSVNSFDAVGQIVTPIGRRDSNIVNFEQSR